MSYKQEFYNFNGDLDATKDVKKLKEVYLKVIDEFKAKKLECLSIVNDETQKKIIKQISEELRVFETILFLGTGGSSLGGKTLYAIKNNLFINTNSPKVYFIENIDSEPIIELLNNIDLKKTGIVVVSKSGETIETLSQFFLIKDLTNSDLKL